LGGWSLIQRSAVRNYYLHHRDLLRSHRCGELRCACHRCRS